jgi:hypothetical protein
MLASEELWTIGREIETAATALRRLRAELPDRGRVIVRFTPAHHDPIVSR